MFETGESDYGANRLEKVGPWQRRIGSGKGEFKQTKCFKKDLSFFTMISISVFMHEMYTVICNMIGNEGRRGGLVVERQTLEGEVDGSIFPQVVVLCP